MILCCYPICGSEMHDAEQGQGGVLVLSFSLLLSHLLSLSVAHSIEGQVFCLRSNKNNEASAHII